MASHNLNIKNRIYVGNLVTNLQASQLFEIFSSFGPIKAIQKKYPTYAFIEYDNPNSAQIAIKQMNGIDIAGRKISVKTVKTSANQLENDSENSMDTDDNFERNSASGEIRIFCIFLFSELKFNQQKCFI